MSIIWVTKCDVCHRIKLSSKRPRALFGDMRVGAPLYRISIVLVGPLPETERKQPYTGIDRPF